MIRVAIVEDEKAYAEQLESFLHRYEEETGAAFEITSFSDGDQIVATYRAQFDIILMDVQMKFMDGMSAATEIRKQDNEVVIIFITNMPQFAIKGYEVGALDYVLKPISYFAFSQRLAKAIQRMNSRKIQYSVIAIKGGMMRMAVNDIYYIESRGHNLIYHTAQGVLESTGTMTAAEERFKKYGFCRGNKGYLINLNHVEGMKDACAIVKGEQLVLSRAKKNEFMEELAKFWENR